MYVVPIPNWNAQGVLPPTDPSHPASRTHRSPYVVSLVDFVLRFGISRQRCSILSGFLSFRSALHNAGLVKGFQWLDGSFLEQIEAIENRDPNDVDVVTFFDLLEGQTERDIVLRDSRLIDPERFKDDYKVDAYFIPLYDTDLEVLVHNSIYWYSLWSHRRNERWKGFVQIDLSPTADGSAKANLEELQKRGGDL